MLMEKLFLASLFLAGFASIANLISPAAAVYSVGHSLMGSIGIMAASVWQIPLCLYLTRNAGMMITIIVNTLLGIFSPLALGRMAYGWLWPYLWPAKLAESFMGIEVNGIFSGNITVSPAVVIVLMLSFVLYLFFVFLDAGDFSKREGKS